MKSIDLNVDMGEGFANESEFMPMIHSCNIACGGHAGSVEEIKRIVDLAQENQVKVGAHPSYPDKENFGRKSIKINRKALEKSIEEQLMLFLDSIGDHSLLHHIKPHGALYNDCAKNPELAEVFLRVMERVCPKAVLFTLPGSVLGAQAKRKGMRIWNEAFLDRAYTDEGHLQSRNVSGAVLGSGAEMYNQLFTILHQGRVKTIDGNWIPMNADTFCLHGDHPRALENLKKVFELHQNQTLK